MFFFVWIFFVQNYYRNSASDTAELDYGKILSRKKNVFLLLKYGKNKVIYYNKNLDNTLDRPISSTVYQC